MTDREITVTLTEPEARAILPQRSGDQTPEEWNRRMDRAEDAQSKIRAELRKLGPVEIEGQESLV